MKYILFLLFIIASCLSCRKENAGQQRPGSGGEVNTKTALVESARQRFLENEKTKGVTNPYAGPKSVNWQQAYVSVYKNREAVVVPIQFQKDVSFQSSITKQRKKINDHAKLYMYKNDQGNFQTEVVYTFPSGASTLVQVEDWNGKQLGSYHLKEGKSYPLKSKAAGESTASRGNAMSCFYVDWYHCPEGSNDLSDCDLLGTQFLGCEEQEPQQTQSSLNDDVGQGSGGGEVYLPLTVPEFTLSSESGNITTVNEGTTRRRNYQWTFLKSATVKFISIEEATQSNASGEWRFTGIRHLNTEMIGNNPEWVITHVVSSVTESVQAYQASVAFEARVNLSAIIRNKDFNFHNFYNCKKNWGVNDGN